MISAARDMARDITPPLIWRFAGRLVAKIRPAPPKHNPMVKDPFLELALRSIVPGWLHQGNVELFDYCFANLPSGAPVVEIGSFAGLSLITIIHLLERHGRSNPVFSVDEWTWPNPNRADVFRADTVSLEEPRHLVIETFRRNVSYIAEANCLITSWQSLTGFSPSGRPAIPLQISSPEKSCAEVQSHLLILTATIVTSSRLGTFRY
jgi:hypothetical protein